MTKKTVNKELNLEGFAKNKKFVLIAVISIIVVAVFFSVFMPKEPQKCDDIDCFVSNANDCNSTIYLETSEIGIIEYSISANKTGCVLTKEIVELNESEDAFIKEALKGKKMACIYQKGNFNGQWIVSLIEGLESCTGDLKDAIANLLLTV